MQKNIKIESIVLDAGTQVRSEIDEATVADYAAAYLAKNKFPPVDTFVDGNRYLLADGFHRVLGAKRAGLETIDAVLRSGTKSDCIKFALGCNARHGKRRTNADKRHAVEIALAEFSKLSNRAIAEICSVSHDLVSELRADVSKNESGGDSATSSNGSASKSTHPPPPTRRRVGRDGKKYPPPPSRPRTSPPKEPEVPRDKLGWPIPEKIMAIWNDATKWHEYLTKISEVRTALRHAQEQRDPTCAEVSYSSVLPHLDQAYSDVKRAVPFAVCATCQGQIPGRCVACHGRGFVSEFFWDNCVPKEKKTIREKARK